MKLLPWTHPPAGFHPVTWKGNGTTVQDAHGVVDPTSGATIFQVELSDNDRRQLIEGNPLFLLIIGPVAPFFESPNLADVLEVARRGM